MLDCDILMRMDVRSRANAAIATTTGRGGHTNNAAAAAAELKGQAQGDLENSRARRL